MFKNIYIIGLGLLGGSLGLAIKEKKLAEKISGIARKQETIDYAVSNNIIDIGYTDFSNICEADFIILATPVSIIINHIKELSKLNLNKDVIITDVGSTKQKICETADSLMDCFVGSHPMAGSEKSGIKYADKDLFKNKVCIVTETDKKNTDKSLKVIEFWRILSHGFARTVSSVDHDKIVSEISHLPHLNAAVLIETVRRNSFLYAGDGLKDTTRIASGDSNMWKDILITNKQNILKSMDLFKENFEKIRELLENDKINEIVDLFDTIKKKRNEFIKEKNKKL